MDLTILTSLIDQPLKI